jgi:hypothetical protein
MMLAGWSQEAEDALVELADELPTSHLSTQDTITVVNPASPLLQSASRLSPLPSEVDPSTPEVTPPGQGAPQSQQSTLTADCLPYYAPEAIYQRYLAAKAAWFKAQPRGSLRTSQAYRKAVGLPQRYSKEAYAWCQDYKQMGQHCSLPGGERRKWTKEEMMSYLDWDTEEDRRTDMQVKWRIDKDPNEAARRGAADIWKQAGEDLQAQEALYS